ncbi:MAG TPA: L-seryl-tRNA(Sec) selenium transferase, partial [Eubacteriaceae bacterium]|nr:L-seryl-tRNA(Sec) selenium transferase [Eubacteriaceae bacterium]
MRRGDFPLTGIDLNRKEALVEYLLIELSRRFEHKQRSALKKVINATGIVLHTNLGRAPLPKESIDKVAEVSSGYSNLEYDLGKGARGSRYNHLEQDLCSLTGAQAALVVNNNAAAVFLALHTFA